VLADQTIELIEKAQEQDGYINTYFTVKEQGKRWTNLCQCHELYCAGHLIEAAVAYYQAANKPKLLTIACEFADHIDKTLHRGPHRQQVSDRRYERVSLSSFGTSALPMVMVTKSALLEKHITEQFPFTAVFITPSVLIPKGKFQFPHNVVICLQIVIQYIEPVHSLITQTLFNFLRGRHHFFVQKSQGIIGTHLSHPPYCCLCIKYPMVFYLPSDYED